MMLFELAMTYATSVAELVFYIVAICAMIKYLRKK